MSARVVAWLGLLLWAPSMGQTPRPAYAVVPELPAGLSKIQLQALLQQFAAAAYKRGFRHLGDERDCDHGHILFSAAKPQRPVAVLYHTQELAHLEPAQSDYGFVDAGARNWIQWIDSGQVENASRYERRAYPKTAAWDYFRLARLPELARRHTILDEMLDPALGLTSSQQWEFTRLDCRAQGPNIVRVVLPDASPVCLAITAS